MIKLRKPATALRVKLTSVLKESPALIAKAGAGKVGRLRLTVIALNTKHKRHTVSKVIKVSKVLIAAELSRREVKAARRQRGH